VREREREREREIKGEKCVKRDRRIVARHKKKKRSGYVESGNYCLLRIKEKISYMLKAMPVPKYI
jgi:hypothetical protein